MAICRASGAAGNSSQEGPGPRLQLGSAERLGDVVVRARVQQRDLLLVRMPGGEHHDRNSGPLADLATHVGARDIRQPQVEDDQVRPLGCGAIDTLAAGGRLDHLGAAAWNVFLTTLRICGSSSMTRIVGGTEASKARGVRAAMVNRSEAGVGEQLEERVRGFQLV